MAKEKKKAAPGIDYKKQSDLEKEEALETALAKIEKDFGKGAVMKFGQNAVENVPVISTGTLSLDMALGTGGIPKGRITEIYGPESSGKTTIALHIVAQAQRAGGIAGFIDAEHALDPIYARNLGVNIEELYISQPDHGDQALDITEAMVRSGAIDIIVIDSVAALVPKAELEGNMGASHVGLHARLMSQALRKLTGYVHKTNCAVVFINQVREKIGGMGYGENTVTTGGRALKFYASMRLEIKYVGKITVNEIPVGNRTKVKVAKNKLAPPFKLCEFDIMYGKGVSREGDIIDLAVDLKIVKKSGAWFSFNEIKLGQGRESAKRFLAENPEVSVEIENAVRRENNLAEINDNKESDGGEPDSKADAKEKRAKGDSPKAAKEGEAVLESFEFEGDLPDDDLESLEEETGESMEEAEDEGFSDEEPVMDGDYEDFD